MYYALGNSVCCRYVPQPTAISKTLNNLLARSLTAIIYIRLLATEKEEASGIKGSMGDGKGAIIDGKFRAPQSWARNINCCIHRVPERYASISKFYKNQNLNDGHSLCTRH